MSEATNIFHVSKKENLDAFVKKFIGENQCCDRAEIAEKNDAFEVRFFPKEPVKQVEKIEEVKKMSEAPKSKIHSVADMFASSIEQQIIDSVKEKTESIEKQMNEELEKVKKKSAELDGVMATIQRSAKEKMAILDATINTKFLEQDKKTNEKLDSQEKKCASEVRKIWDLFVDIEKLILGKKPQS